MSDHLAPPPPTNKRLSWFSRLKSLSDALRTSEAPAPSPWQRALTGQAELDPGAAVHAERTGRALHCAKPRALPATGSPMCLLLACCGTAPGAAANDVSVLHLSYAPFEDDESESEKQNNDDDDDDDDDSNDKKKNNDENKKSNLKSDRPEAGSDEDQALRTSLALFAFPHSVQRSPIISTNDALNELEKSRKSFEEKVFLFTMSGSDVADTTRLRYGVCIHVYCIAERVGETSVVLGQQCLIVLSHVPLLSIHEQVLRIWFDKQCDTVETRLKQHEKSNTFDDAFNDDNFVDDDDSFKFQDQLAKAYGSAQFPAAGARTFFRGPHNEAIFGTRPLVDPEEDELARWCVARVMRRCLAPKDFCDLLSAVLLETKLVFVCDDLALLSALVLVWVPLLRPFIWQGALIPVLPSRLEPLLGAPMPLICGIAALDQRTQAALVSPEAIVVRVASAKDSVEVTWQSGESVHETLLRIPEYKKLQKSIENNVKSLSTQKNSHHDIDLLCQAISGNAQDHLESFFAEFKAYCVRDTSDTENPVSAFMPQSFLSSIEDESERDWFAQFFETQLWSEYCQQRLAKNDSMKTKSPR